VAEVCSRFTGTYSFHLQDLTVNQARDQQAEQFNTVFTRAGHWFLILMQINPVEIVSLVYA
jgi:hypothetical protein